MYINKNNKVVFNFLHARYNVRYNKFVQDEAFNLIAIILFQIKDNYDSAPIYTSPYPDCNLDFRALNVNELVKSNLTQHEFMYS